MTHPIIDLQTQIVSKLNADVALVSLIGADAIFDMPPKGGKGIFLTILRHDIIVRDADLSPGNDHRLQLRIWGQGPSRGSVLVPTERVIAVLTLVELGSPTLSVTHVNHVRTDTQIDLKTGRATATIFLRILSEPAV